MSDEDAPSMGRGILHPEGIKATAERAGLVHEINNILVIIGNAHLAKKNASNPAANEKYLVEVRHAAEEGRELMRDLAAFASDNPLQTRVLSLNRPRYERRVGPRSRRHARPEQSRSSGPSQPLAGARCPGQADSIHGFYQDRRIDPTRNPSGRCCGRLDDRRRRRDPKRPRSSNDIHALRENRTPPERQARTRQNGGPGISLGWLRYRWRL